MAGHQLIDAYLAELATRLPAEVVDELADGLGETWRRHQAVNGDTTAAAQAAIAEFGTVQQVSDAFVAQAPGRRLARLLLASGPLVGAVWGVTLVADHVWRWPVPTAVAAGYVLALLAVVILLVSAGARRATYRRTRLGMVGALGLVALDLGMVVAALTLAPALVWPTAIAIPASLTRTTVVLCRLPRRTITG
jgi:hypothetical protein